MVAEADDAAIILVIVPALVAALASRADDDAGAAQSLRGDAEAGAVARSQESLLSEHEGPPR